MVLSSIFDFIASRYKGAIVSFVTIRQSFPFMHLSELKLSDRRADPIVIGYDLSCKLTFMTL